MVTNTEYLLFNGRLAKTAVLFATPLPDRQSSEQTPTCHIYLLLGVFMGGSAYDRW